MERDPDGHPSPGHPDSAFECQWRLVPEAANVSAYLDDLLTRVYLARQRDIDQGYAPSATHPFVKIGRSISVAYVADLGVIDHTLATPSELFAAHVEEAFG